MKKSETTHLKIKEKETEPDNAHQYFRIIFHELVEKIPDLEKEKYSNILIDFLGPYRVSFPVDLPLFWYVGVELDPIIIAKFECKTCGNYKRCKLKAVNGESFDGDVEFHFYEFNKNIVINSPSVKIYIRSLYVADYRPRILGKNILNLVKKMADSLQPDVVATLDDVSNVKVLALMATGESYYEHMGFHYVHKDGTRIIQERKDFQKTKISSSLLVSCVSQRLEEQMQVWASSFLFNKHLKQEILEALKKEVGQGSRQLKDFWKVYRNVMKNVDFYALKEKFGSDEHLQRCAKTYFFTRYLRECLQEQIIKDEGIFTLSTLERMSYP